MFKVLGGDCVGSTQPVGHLRPSIRDFVWDGVGQCANFEVVCLPGVAPGAVDCRVRLAEGSSATHLSFRIEVVEAGQKWEVDDTAKMEELNARLCRMEQGVEGDDDRELTIFNTELVSGIQVRRRELQPWMMLKCTPSAVDFSACCRLVWIRKRQRRLKIVYDWDFAMREERR